MTDPSLPDILTELQGWSPERRRNEVVRILAALDLLSDDQIHRWAMRVKLDVTYTSNRRDLLEAIRRELLK